MHEFHEGCGYGNAPRVLIFSSTTNPAVNHTLRKICGKFKIRSSPDRWRLKRGLSLSKSHKPLWSRYIPWIQCTHSGSPIAVLVVARIFLDHKPSNDRIDDGDGDANAKLALVPSPCFARDNCVNILFPRKCYAQSVCVCMFASTRVL